MIFAKNKERVPAIRAAKYQKNMWREIYSPTRTFGAKVQKSNIWVEQVWNTKLDWKDEPFI